MAAPTFDLPVTSGVATEAGLETQVNAGFTSLYNGTVAEAAARAAADAELAARADGTDVLTAQNRLLGLIADDGEAGVTADHAFYLAEQLRIRVSELEATIATLSANEADMTVYPIALTAGTVASIIVADGTNVQRMQVQNRSANALAAIAFGNPPASIGAAGAYVLEPGQALDTTLIPSLPIYVVAEATAEISGAFSVPQDEPNFNWEVDLQALITGMGGTAPSIAYENAYRNLYSALRRLNVISKAQGLFVHAAHNATAAAVNWKNTAQTLTAVGAPSFTAAQGFSYGGVDDYHDTSLRLTTFFGSTTSVSLDLSGFVFPGTDDQPTGRAALGDGVLELQPNRSPTQAALKTGTAGTDVVTIPSLGSMLGFSRRANETATAFVAGGVATRIVRERTQSYPPRDMLIGCSRDSSNAPTNFYQGLIRASYFGRALTDREMFGVEAAFNQFFASIATLGG